MGYTQELADAICGYLAQGESLRTVCKREGMPCVATIFNWFRDRPDFLEQYARAKEEAADALADEMLDIADAKDEDVNRSRLKVDTRKWLASKLKPKKYSDKTDINLNVEGLSAWLAKADEEWRATGSADKPVEG